MVHPDRPPPKKKSDWTPVISRGRRKLAGAGGGQREREVGKSGWGRYF